MNNQQPNNPRVNIQFSLELDELPDEIDRLLTRSSERLACANQSFTNLKNSTDILTSQTWKEIEDLRLQLSKADFILDDVHKILGGYLQMASEQYATQQEPESPSPSPEPVTTPEVAYDPMHQMRANHPDARQQRREKRSAEVNDMKNQMGALMEQFKQMQAGPNYEMTEEEVAASEIMKQRMQKIMGAANEESAESTEPKV